ncbi:MAG: MFS transporter [Stenotrophobium sp.]
MSTDHGTAASISSSDYEGNVIHVDPHKVAPGEIAVGVIIGRTAEFFDFFVFGIATVVVFPEVFFPFVSPMNGTLYSFMIFSLAFIARPLGSLMFRSLHDLYGRGTKLTAALFTLGTATAGIAFLPGYDDLGKTAIGLLVALRIIQGLAVGGSWDGLPSLLALSAPEKHRGWYAMLPQFSAPLGFMIAAALFAYLNMSLSHDDFIQWGWRYPFYVAFAMNVVALFARLRLVVTPEFTRLLQTRELEPSPVGDLLRTQWRNILLGAFAPLASYALFHLITVFALSWAILFTKQSVGHFLIIQIIGAAVAMLSMLISGKVADRIGRRQTLAVAAGLIAVYSGWSAVLLSGSTTGGYIFIMLGFALLGFSHAQSAGAINSRFPSIYRYSGAAVTSDLSWLLGAAFAPLVALELALHLGVGYVGLYLLTGAIGTFAALRVNRSLEMRDE